MKSLKKIRFNVVLIDTYADGKEERRAFTITAFDLNDALKKMFDENSVNDHKVDLNYLKLQREVNNWNFKYLKKEFMDALIKNFPIGKKNSHFVLNKIEIESTKVINLNF